MIIKTYQIIEVLHQYQPQRRKYLKTLSESQLNETTDVINFLLRNV